MKVTESQKLHLWMLKFLSHIPCQEIILFTFFFNDLEILKPFLAHGLQ